MSDTTPVVIEDGFVPRASVKRRPEEPGKRAQKLAGHEAYIESLRVDGAEIRIELVNGKSATGTIKTADKYTVSIMTEQGNTRVVFKHAMVEISPTKRGMVK